MTTAATATATLPPPSGGTSRAKRKFFRRLDPYAKHYRPARTETAAEGGKRRGPSSSSSSTCTVHGSAFGPPSGGNDGGRRRPLVACTSDGRIAVWDPRPSSEGSASSAPILVVDVGGEGISKDRTLYNLQFIRKSDGDHFLVASGDPGALIYRWRDFEAAIGAVRECDDDAGGKPKCQDPQGSGKSAHCPFTEPRPIATFRPHPSPLGESVEINCTSYCEANGILYGAAGDAFGCYQWDLATERLVGTFGGASRFDGGGHQEYLHVVKTIPACEGIGSRYVVTGGEDGNMGFWDGKDGKLVEMMNVQGVMDQNKESVASDTMANSRSFASGLATPWNHGSKLWVSSVDCNDNWLAACSGAENANGSIASRSGPGGAGFVTLWHLPTRTFAAGRVTRESVNAAAYGPSSDCFVTGGNEGRVSFWEATTLRRAGRSWSTPPGTYTISVDGESMIVGGSGGTLDCFADRVKVSKLELTS